MFEGSPTSKSDLYNQKQTNICHHYGFQFPEQQHLKCEVFHHVLLSQVGRIRTCHLPVQSFFQPLQMSVYYLLILLAELKFNSITFTGLWSSQHYIEG